MAVIADEELGTGSVTITLDDTGADASARALGDRIERILDRASRDAGIRMGRNITRAVRAISPVRVRVEADLRAFGHSIDTLANFDPITLPVDPDVDRARFEAAIQATLDGLEVSVRVVPDLDGFDAAIRAHNAPTVNVNVDVDRGSVSRLTSILSGLGGALGGVGRASGSALKIGAVGIAAAGATQSIVGLAAALAPAAGAVAALPAVILGAQVALGTLKLATAGVGDAFSALASGDTKALDKALKGLSPAARTAVESLRELAPQLKAVQQGVQDSFFKQFGADIKGAVTNLLPLGKGLEGISAEFGKAVDQALKFGASKDAIAALQGVLSGTRLSLTGLSDATAPVLKGFLDIAASVSTAFGAKLGAGIGQAGAELGTFLSGLAASGRAVELVKGAGEVFRQLGTIASNVGGIISGVFGVANDVGGGLLNNLGLITGKIEEFVKSAQGQESIGNLFKTISVVAAQLSPILTALVTQLGSVAPALAPLFTAIGPAITGIINALGPAIAALLPGIQKLVGSLSVGLLEITQGGAITALGSAFGKLLSALAPLLPVAGQLIGALGTALAPVLAALATAIAPVVSAFSNILSSILPPLTSAFLTLVRALTPIVVIIGQALGQALSATAPLFTTLAGLVEQVATAFVPLIQQVTAALIPALDALIPAITQIVAALIPLAEAIIAAVLPALPPLISAVIAIQSAILPLIPVVTQLAAQLIGFATTLITALGPVLQFVAGVVSWTAINVVVPLIDNIVSVISGLSTVLGFVVRIAAGFVRALISGFTYLGQTIPKLVSSLVSAVTGFFQSLPGKAATAVGALVGALTGVFNSAKAAVLGKSVEIVSEAVRIVRELPGKAKAALSGIGSLLTSAGADLIRGMVNGIASMAGSLASKARDVVGGAVSAAKNALGIKSPSRVFYVIGLQTGQGLINGMASTESAIRAAADKLVSAITGVFKGKNARIDDVLVARVRATEKVLLGLAARREAIADRIKKANEFAASTAASTAGAFSLDKLFQQGKDAAANGAGAFGASGLIASLNASVAKIKSFNNQINILAKKGLRKDLLSQIIGLGPEQGAALASTLTNATGAQLNDINAAQKQLAAASVKLGKDSADKLFDAGTQAAKGFLAGLKAQQKEIQNLMLTLAKAMASSIRKALGIHSPSRVFRGIGQQTMDGLDGGLKDRLDMVRRTALAAASATTQPFGVPAAGRGSTGGRTGTQRPTSSRTMANTFIINAVGDGEATARRVINRLAGAGWGL